MSLQDETKGWVELTLKGLDEGRDAFARMGILLPSYDLLQCREKTARTPVWVHFGIGNIFRIFLGGIADELLEQGWTDRGIVCAESYDTELVDRIYQPFDNLSLNIILNADGTRTKRVCGALTEAIRARPEENRDWKRLKEIFRAPSLQMVSFTITEKGYQLHDEAGNLFSFAQRDLEMGPEHVSGAMAVISALLLERFRNGGTPLALVSMDNCARNGKMLRDSVLTVCGEWTRREFSEKSFLRWVTDETNVAFDSTMIDKITPRPSEEIAEELEKNGLGNMQPMITGKSTYIAPFVNAEYPQYLVIEDRFPNGRPPLEHGHGVYMADFDTVCRAERMKVTACLNPAHTAVGPLGVVLGYARFADMLAQLPVTLRMAKRVVFDEGLPVAPDPGILSPETFSEEVFQRFLNPYLGDTNLRLATDASQGVGVRFGETIRAYVKRYGSAETLTAIPLGIAGFFRYMMAVDDQGRSYELAPDPLAEDMYASLSSVRMGDPDSLQDQLHPWLSNEKLFHINLYEAGLGEIIESMFRQMITGPGAVLKTMRKYIDKDGDNLAAT